MPSLVIRDFHVMAIFLVLLILAPARNLPLLVAYGLVALYVVLSRVQFFGSLNIRERGAVLLLVLSISLMLPFSVARSATALVHYCVVLVSLGCAFVLTRNLSAYLAASRLSLIAAQATLIAYLWSRGLGSFPLDTVFTHTSSNGITACLVLVQINYSVLKYLTSRRSSLLTSVLTLIICLIGYGRGSIVVATAVVLVNLLASISWRSQWRSLVSIALISGCIALCWAYGRDVADYVQANTKIGGGLYDASRERMLVDYLGRIDAGTLIVGADYSGTSIAAEFYDNPHNSYIRAHHIFGLPYLLSVLLLPPILLWNRRSLAVRLYSLTMLALVLARSITEPLLFPTPFDFYFFAMCFALSSGGVQVSRNASHRPAPPVGTAESE